MIKMIFSNIYERFTPAVIRPVIDKNASMVFVCDSDQLLVKIENGKVRFPDLNDFSQELTTMEMTEFLGMFDNLQCFSLPYDESISIAEGMEFRSLRIMYAELDENIGLVASRAVHLTGWSRKNRYCGVCGTKTLRDEKELARRCPSCGNVIYPKISPAMIIAVVKDNKLLLAHNRNFKGGWYSTLAGFVEPGETIEACAHREVFEEVGIKIKNIRYFGSQPWPFPDSLMIGLTAEYESGEIKPDGIEIDDAGFFGIDELPDTPGKQSVAGRLIDWFVNSQK